MSTQDKLISPYGGSLVNLIVGGAERAELVARAKELPSIQLAARAMCDLELMAVGALSPLKTFLGEADYRSVLETMRLSDGTLYPIPVTLPVSDLTGIAVGKGLAIRHAKNNVIAVMDVEEIYEADWKEEARLVCGTVDAEHPLVSEMSSWGKYRLSGRLRVVQLLLHPDFPELRRTPTEVREVLAGLANPNVVAFQTRNPMHRAHEELTKRAAAAARATLLLHPAVGMTKPGDVDHYTRVRTYKTLVENYYAKSNTVLSLLPLAMRMAGPREAVWHAIVRRNYGANHMIIGRDHAGPGKDSHGKPFYGPNDARELVAKFEPETGVKGLAYEEMVFLPEEDRYEEVTQIPAGARALSISGTEVREKYLAKGVELPRWFTRPETAAILANAYPPLHKHGFCIWFTGLPSAGKSTIAEILTVLLMEHGRQVSLLDGDVVRTHLSKGLGFSREDRDTNIVRIGYVASEIARQGGAVICAAVSPYRATRNQVRAMMPAGHFLETFVDTPVAVCEQRDVKGFYAKARAGEIKDFTGVNDPYEPPSSPEIRVETGTVTAEENARIIIRYLQSRGFILNVKAYRDAPPAEVGEQAAVEASV